MKLLIDTHAALWLFNEHENLPTAVRKHLLDEANELYISIASAWEIAIKHSLGKLPAFSGGVKRFLFAVREYSIELITVLPQYVEIEKILSNTESFPFPARARTDTTETKRPLRAVMVISTNSA